ncbi:MAG: glycosyl hydrolase family 28-related protein [Planctomycetota bacterium]
MGTIRIWVTVLVLAVSGAAQAPEMIANGSFESGLSSWSGTQSLGYTASFNTTTNAPMSGAWCAVVDVLDTPVSPQGWRVQLRQSGLSCLHGETYRVRFSARSESVGSRVTAVLMKNSSPYSTYRYENFDLGSSWETYEFLWMCPATLGGDLRFTLWCGSQPDTLYFDDVSLELIDSSIDPDNRANWSAAGGGEIAIRPVATSITGFGAISDDGVDDSAAIQAALNATPPGFSCFVPNGVFDVDHPIQMPDEVTLLGGSPTESQMVFDLSGAAGEGIAAIEFVKWQRDDYVELASSSLAGDGAISVTDGSLFSVGRLLEVSRANQAEMYTSPSFDVPWAQRAVGEVVRIVGVQEGELILDRPLHYDYPLASLPKVRQFVAVEGSVVENLSIRRTDIGEGYTFGMRHAVGCVVRNVESSDATIAHVWISTSADCRVEGCYFHHALGYGGGRGYGVVCGGKVRDSLVWNNAFDHLRHSMMVKEGASGNVFAFNLSTNAWWPGSGDPADISFHGHWPSLNLFESNVCEKVSMADYWGPCGPGNTLFRNHAEGFQLEVRDHSNHQNLVGNRMPLVFVQWGVFDLRAHSNLVGGSFDWTWNGSLPPSQFLATPPPFWAGKPWPLLGSDVPGGTLPVQDRILAGQPVTPSF